MTAKPNTVRKLMFNVTPSAASLWFDIANISLVIGAVLVALGTYGAITMGSIKERFADVRISENVAATAKANEAAATANERAAKLEKQAAAMRLKLDKTASDAHFAKAIGIMNL